MVTKTMEHRRFKAGRAALAGLAVTAAVATGAGPAAAQGAAGLPPGSYIGTPPASFAGSMPITLQATEQATTVQRTLHSPYAVAVDGQGQVYVANLAAGVTVYTLQGTLVTTITAGVNNPAGVGVMLGGSIYVANNGGNNVTIYNAAFVPSGTINDPTLANPVGLFVDPVGDIWVLDSGTLHLYLNDGTPISSVPADGAAAVSPFRGNIVMWGASYGSSFLNDLENIGAAVHSGINFNFGVLDAAIAGGAAEDAVGRIYVTYPTTNSVAILGSPGGKGAIVATIPTASPGYGVAVDPIHKRFYVAEPGINEVVIYSTVAPYKKIGAIK